jgi:serine protease AprX
MNKILLVLLFPSFLFAQDGAFRYFISFNNKVNTDYSINTPEQYLSLKTIAKRQKYGIPIDSTDLPISSQYLNVITLEGFVIENKSKWFNGVIVSTFDSLLIQTLNHNFIDTVISFGSWQNTKNVSEKWEINYSSADYADAYNQLNMIGGHQLHNSGYKGSGMTIAVIDAGFYKVNELDVFADLQNQILATYDFVDGNTNVYDDHTHGMMVLSTMGAKQSGKMIGTAPEADYLLLRSEDVFSENLIEEYMWVCAAEYADSAGADIINSSLGYTTFDNPIYNHTYSDMDGKTAPISIGAGIACDKGIIVVNSAGNSGNNNWHYIGAPADHPNVLSVGAVDENEEFASFSSYGPNAEGFIKPNVVAQGKNTAVATSSNEVVTGNGTSFSSPITAGMVACLWGANPDKSPDAIKLAIYESADRYLSPDAQFGYGIPNYYDAHQSLYYNFIIPVEITIMGDIKYSVYTIDGKIIDDGVMYYNHPQDAIKIIKPTTAGVYIINLSAEAYSLSKKFIVFE